MMMMVHRHRRRLRRLVMMVMVMGVRRAHAVLVIGEGFLILVLLSRYRAVLPLVVLQRVSHASAAAVIQDQGDTSKKGQPGGAHCRQQSLLAWIREGTAQLIRRHSLNGLTLGLGWLGAYHRARVARHQDLGQPELAAVAYQRILAEIQSTQLVPSYQRLRERREGIVAQHQMPQIRQASQRSVLHRGQSFVAVQHEGLQVAVVREGTLFHGSQQLGARHVELLQRRQILKGTGAQYREEVLAQSEFLETWQDR